jgi:hypothetical protein
MINFPLSAVVDGVLSYLQWVFSKPEITPSEYRWNSDSAISRIRISGPFVIDDEKPGSAPFIVVERGSHSFDNRVMENLKKASANTFETPEHVNWMNGSISITCGSQSGPEASSLANFLAIMLQADKSGIKSGLRFLRTLNVVDVGPEMPVAKDAEIRRYEVTLRCETSLQQGWIKEAYEVKKWNSAAIYAEKDQMFSNTGLIAENSDLLVDESKNFGLTLDSNPQLLPTELSKGWYYIRFKDNENSQLYTIKEIVDNHTVRLVTHNTDNQEVPWVANESKPDVEYDLLWNNINLHVEIPNNNP